MALPKSVLIIITGSVASYKSLELIRLLRAQTVEVTAILSKGGAQFITPLAVSSLTGTNTYTDLFSLTDETEMGHIQLSRVAECVLVAPASANIMAKMATGMSDDLASTALLATNKPVFVAPAMNHKMWSHPATQRNVKQLMDDGVQMIAPTAGDMACGEHGVGRMAEPADIIAQLASQFTSSQSPKPLAGKTAIVTSGPTTEAIDPVRYLCNRSSGKQGHAIAQALANAGASVTLITGSVTIPDPMGLKNIVRVGSAEEMLNALTAALPADIFVGAAAVADWRPAITSAKKIKKQNLLDTLTLEFIPTVDVLGSVATHTERPTLVVGFAAETDELLTHARAKRLRKKCDWLLANDVSGGQVFGDDENDVTLISDAGEEHWTRRSKHAVAEQLVQKIVTHFSTPSRKGKTA